MDDDTSAVVVIGLIVLISIAAGYATYNYVETTRNEPIVHGFPPRQPTSYYASYNKSSIFINYNLRAIAPSCPSYF